MKIKDIALWLNPYEFNESPPLTVALRANSLCHYISTNVLKTNKHEGNGFNLLSIKGCLNPTAEVTIVPEKALDIQVTFDDIKYATLNEMEVNDYFIELINAGLAKANKVFEIPAKEIDLCMKEFVKGGYKNQWLHQKKANKERGLLAVLMCELTTEEFVLTLSVSKGNENLITKVLLKSLPSEIAFKHRFKDITWAEDNLIITDFQNRPNFIFPIEDIFNHEITIKEEWLEKRFL